MDERDVDTADIDFVIIGAQKSASTFLQRCLTEHPQIQMPPGESRHFEDPYFGEGAVQELPDLFGPRRPSVRRGIKRPDYLAREPVAERLASVFPEVKLVAVLREPVARAVSAYYDYVRLGFAPLEPVDDAFEHILDETMQRRYPRAADVLDYGLYGKHLTRYLSLFSRSQVHVVLQEDIRTDPLLEVQTTLRFLDVDDTFVPTALTSKSNPGVYSPLRLRLLRSRNRYRFTYAADLSRREPRRPGPVALAWVAAATVIDRRVLAPFDHSGVPALDPTIRQRLQEYFAPDVELLESLLDRPLPNWHTAT